MRGVVKFFDLDRGFGFIRNDEGGEDIFVHATVMRQSGLEDLSEGDLLEFEASVSERTGRIAATSVRLVKKVKAGPFRSDKSDKSATRDEPIWRPAQREIIGEGAGAVKWFNSDKGFGFIQPEDGGQDLFVHVTQVRSAGFEGLKPGQRLAYSVERDQRTGKEAASALRIRTE